MVFVEEDVKDISEVGMGSKELDRLIILKWDNRGRMFGP